jgi:hypothetical protein
MVRRFAAVLVAFWLIPAIAVAQQPVPLYPGAAPRSFEAEPLPPLPPPRETPGTPTVPPAAVLAPPPADAAPPATAAAGSVPQSAPVGRVFCEQPVTVQVSPPDAVPERFRPFVGLWSDASWTPSLCAALIVERVNPDGAATIVYVFGPMGANPRGRSGVVGGVVGGILHGTGIIRDGELRFQNSDGSQFAFRPVYADLGGRLTTPQGQSYQAIFKKTP